MDASIARRAAATIVCAIAVAAFTTATTTGQTGALPERFIAFAVNMGGPGPTRSGTVEIVVTRWSTEAERNRLVNVLLDKGPAALLDALQDTRSAGYLRTPNSIGYDLHFARETAAEDGGRRVILVTDRPIGFWEASRQPRSIDYPFTLIEIRLNRDGEGEGKMSIAAKITANKALGLIELEDYATEPVRLLSVHSTGAMTR